MAVANDFMDIDFGPSEIGASELNSDFNVEFVDERDASDFQSSISQTEISQEVVKSLRMLALLNVESVCSFIVFLWSPK
jgi:hypothetical protein